MTLGVFVAIGVYGLWGLVGHRGPALKKAPSPKVDLEVQKASYTAYAGDTHWGFEAEEVSRWAEKEVLIAKGLRLWANLKDGRRLEAEAGQGKASQTEGVVELQGGVKVRFQDLELEAEALTYQVRDSLLRSPSSVRVRKGDLLLQGQGFSFDLDGRRLALGGGVKAVLGGRP